MILFAHNSTLKQGCKAGIKIKLSEDKKSLVVMEMCEEHNHHVDKVFELSIVIKYTTALYVYQTDFSVNVHVM